MIEEVMYIGAVRDELGAEKERTDLRHSVLNKHHQRHESYVSR